MLFPLFGQCAILYAFCFARGYGASTATATATTTPTGPVVGNHARVVVLEYVECYQKFVCVYLHGVLLQETEIGIILTTSHRVYYLLKYRYE